MLARTQYSVAALTFLSVLANPASAQSTARVSVNSAGSQADFGSYTPSTSTDGRFVAFYSDATNLVSGDTNGWTDVFRRDTQTGQTTRMSVNSAGAQGNHSSYSASISADGRFVVFYSDATNLIAADSNGWTDVFMRDTQTGQTTCVSVDSAGAQGSGYSDTPSISGDGRFVAFRSSVSSLVPMDTNDYSDVFVRDVQTGQTTRVSLASAGAQSNGASYAPAISSDGRFVAFFSGASNLVAGDTNNSFDVFVHDMQTGQTTRVSVNSVGGQGNDYSYRASISANGRFIAFYSFASNLVSGDTNGHTDVFVRDMQMNQTSRVSVDSAGAQSDGDSDAPSISADGRLIAFHSYADDLVAGDTNGMADVLVHDTQTGLTTRVSVDALGAQSDFANHAPSISGDGLFVAFQSEATNLVTGDTNNASDVFVREWWHGCHVDADSDGFGAGPPVFFSIGACGVGYSTNASDCDDSLASVHPGAADPCNGIDDDCDGVVDDANAPVPYCIAGLTTNGCTSSIAAVGAASSIQPSGFQITCTSVEGQRMGLIFYGLSPTFVPWAIGSTSYICVSAPVQRTHAFNSGGTAGSCNGTLTLDFNAYIHVNPTALGNPFAGGQMFYAQAWFRDPAAPGATNLSNGLRFTLCN